MPDDSQEQLDVKTPFFSGTLKGTSTQVLLAVLIIALSAAIGFFAYEHDVKAAGQAEKIIATMEKNRESSEEMFRAVIYVNWKCLQSKAECAKLNLAKPKVLRDMER